jgi:hypothetical protein
LGHCLYRILRLFLKQWRQITFKKALGKCSDISSASGIDEIVCSSGFFTGEGVGNSSSMGTGSGATPAQRQDLAQVQAAAMLQAMADLAE